MSNSPDVEKGKDHSGSKNESRQGGDDKPDAVNTTQRRPEDAVYKNKNGERGKVGKEWQLRVKEGRFMARQMMPTNLVTYLSTSYMSPHLTD